MDSFADERDLNVLKQDRYAFFVLRHVLAGKTNRKLWRRMKWK